ncbi:monosaccharide ABC transporter ATP-binding protein (CUT2 family) [Mobilisporobacter senegalensis]|uniref:Monosaccharide ABC transporter ATP-binding protein (CUT2 family) n=1 Tax=Mobilisporobacter senegalensis TaxID=1329262 RepID=A0A3N1XVP4_9FIRM|nr:sugar ABC transporter ATP-binding protein [Mobilisporobacter senegalensis]ROR30695.1 monosaccharide ABC transporter ATP-binding protein (CUT2 family) [Mobilisporobacter senegalensis]
MTDKEKENKEVCLHAECIDKIYPGTKALDNVSFDVLKGKVNVLIGENGAGKSTLMKIIAGIEQPSSGTISMDGKEVFLRDTTEARKHGIGIIHQELSLFPNLNVYQNIFMAREKTKGKVTLDNKTHIDLTNKILEKLEFPLDTGTLIGDLRVGQQQMIEIARNLIQDDLKILIMDEPTSSLSQQEVEVLFKLMRELTASGISIVYISHRLEEIMKIGDHVTILRDGRYVAEADVKDIDVPWIVQKMVGEGKSYPRRERNIDWDKCETVLQVNNLSLPKSGGGFLLDNVSFELKKGEILGIYGLMGAGRTEIFECIMGLRPEHTGTIMLEGETLSVKSISEQIDKGFAIVPEDRQQEGIVQTMNIAKNISLSSLKNYGKRLFLDSKKENQAIDEEIKDIHIKVANKNLPILSLSGGNQQKVVIGKGILTNPRILLLDEPSRGIDIGAKTEVFDIINQYAERGLSIIVISSELKEIIAIADRIMVLSNGIKTGELTGDEIKEEHLVLASYKGHHGH